MWNNLRLSGFFIVFFLSILIPTLNAETGLSSMLDSDKTISMDLQNASLKDVLKIFSIQSGLNFIASEALKDRTVTMYLDNVPIQDAMVRIFKANKLNYEYDEEANIFTVNYADDITVPDMITRVYTLKYRSVSSANLEKEKANLFTGSTVTSGTLASGGGGGGASGSGANILEALKQLLSKNGKIAEDNKTNSIIISDLASKFPVIEQVLARLDIPQPQVMLEVEMLDVEKNVVDKMGFNFGSESSPSPFTMVLDGSLGQSRAFIGDLTNRGASIGTTTKGSLVAGKTLSMVLDFLNRQKSTKYLARPRILTLNNETAEIGIVKDEVVSTKITTVTPQGGGPSTTGTEFERATSLSLTPEGIGIYLRVTPQINIETGEINLVINPKTSSTEDSPINTETLSAKDPTVRATKSIVKIYDGETVVLGGLIHSVKDETDLKAPILGDIPFIGALFRHKNATNKEKELLVFITPRIVKDRTIKIAQGTGPIASNSAYPSQQPLAAPGRKQAIVEMLNTFERERSKR